MLRIVLACFALGAAGCRTDDDGNPIPSSDWTWQCPDGTPAPDAGCPPDDADGGDGDGGDDDGGSG